MYDFSFKGIHKTLIICNASLYCTCNSRRALLKECNHRTLEFESLHEDLFDEFHAIDKGIMKQSLIRQSDNQTIIDREFKRNREHLISHNIMQPRKRYDNFDVLSGPSILVKAYTSSIALDPTNGPRHIGHTFLSKVTHLSRQ